MLKPYKSKYKEEFHTSKTQVGHIWYSEEFDEFLVIERIIHKTEIDEAFTGDFDYGVVEELLPDFLIFYFSFPTLEAARCLDPDQLEGYDWCMQTQLLDDSTKVDRISQRKINDFFVDDNYSNQL